MDLMKNIQTRLYKYEQILFDNTVIVDRDELFEIDAEFERGEVVIP